MEKGYEHTTLQDIIDNLGGLTKGAIYHHFKAKEEILLAIADRMGEQTGAWMRTVRDDPGRPGEAAEDVPGIPGELGPDGPVHFGLPNIFEEPQADRASCWRGMIERVLPNYIGPSCREAVADGSIGRTTRRTGGAASLCQACVAKIMIYPATPRATAAWAMRPDAAGTNLDLLDRELLNQ